jgi:hypothetical protein
VRRHTLALRDETRSTCGGGQLVGQLAVLECRGLDQRVIEQRHEHDPDDRAAVAVPLAARVGGELSRTLVGCRLERRSGAAVANVAQAADDGESDVARVAEGAVESAALPAACRPVEELLLLGLELALLAQDEDRLPAPASLVELLFGCAPPALLLRAIARPDEQDEHVALGDAVEQRTLRARRSRADGLRAHRVRAEALNSGPRRRPDVLEAALDRANEHGLHQRTS